MPKLKPFAALLAEVVDETLRGRIEAQLGELTGKVTAVEAERDAATTERDALQTQLSEAQAEVKGQAAVSKQLEARLGELEAAVKKETEARQAKRKTTFLEGLLSEGRIPAEDGDDLDGPKFWGDLFDKDAAMAVRLADKLPKGIHSPASTPAGIGGRGADPGAKDKAADRRAAAVAKLAEKFQTEAAAKGEVLLFEKAWNQAERQYDNAAKGGAR